MYARYLPILLLILVLVSCSKERRVQEGYCALGSEEFNYLVDHWNALNRKQNKEARALLHEGKGNAVGPHGLKKGICDMAVMTRPMSNPEMDGLVKKYGRKPLVIPVAVEALQIVVPANLPLKSIRKTELKQIFENTPATLGDLFKNQPAIAKLKPRPYGLNSASDRFRWFREALLKTGKYSDKIKEVAGPLELVDLVGKSRAGFGYARPAEITDQVRVLPVISENETELRNDPKYKKYPFYRYYYIYILTKQSRLSPEVSRFLSLVLSPSGQKALLPQGLFPLSEKERLLQIQKLKSVSGESIISK